MPRPNIVVLDGLTLCPRDYPKATGPVPKADRVTYEVLREIGELTAHDYSAPDEVVPRAASADVVLVNKVQLTREVLGKLPKLRYIGVLATGYNNVDLAAAAERKIVVCNIPGYGSDSVAQHAMALLLDLAGRVTAHYQAVQKGEWSKSRDFCFYVGPTTELAGKTLGIVGLGAIGRRSAQIGAALGMNIVAYDQYKSDVPGVNVRWLEVDELFAQSDAVTLHCPLTEQTRHIVNAQRLSRMKPTSFIINTARGPLVDEAALAAALHKGQIAGAGLDVLEVEPPRPDNPLFAAPNCIITPHIAWASTEARRRLLGIAVDNLRAFLAGKPVNVVNKR